MRPITPLTLVALSALLACDPSPSHPSSNAPDDPFSEPIATTEGSVSSCLAAGGSLTTIASIDNGHGAVHTLTITDDNTIVLSAEDGSLKTWRLEFTDTEVADGESSGVSLLTGADYLDAFVATDGPATSLAYDRTTEGVLSGASSGDVSLWTLPDGDQVAAFSAGDTGIASVAISDDGTRIASAEAMTFGANRIGDRQGLELATVEGIELWEVLAIDFLPGTHQLLLSGHWYGEPLVELRGEDPNELLALWWVNPTGPMMGDSAVRGVAVHPDGDQAVAFGGGYLTHFDPTEQNPNLMDAETTGTVLTEDHHPRELALAQDGSFFVTAGDDGSLRVWDFASLEALGALEIPGGAGLALADEDRLIITADADGFLHVISCQNAVN